MKKKCIFHIPFKIDKNYAAASQIRPMKMIQAFKDIGYDVDVVSGYGKERKEKIKVIKNNIKKGIKYDFIYSESSTEPTLLTEKNHLPIFPLMDFSFMKFCKKNNIKIGLFYRDIHWKFDQYKQSVGFLKRTVAYIFYYYDLFMYNKILDVMFLPSIEMGKYIPLRYNYERMKLPSGCDYINCEDNQYKVYNDKINIFYSGGLGKLYDLELVFKVINEDENYTLTVVCRENEWKSVENKYKKYINSRIKILHLKDKELDEEAKNADVFCLLTKPSQYWKFAMPMKLFYYLSHKKPIIAVKGGIGGRFIEENNIGYTCEYELDSIKNKLKEIYEHRSELEFKFKNMNEVFERNTWEQRAREVKDELMKSNF